MGNHTNHMPKAEPHWIALGIVVWSVAIALGPKRRRVFIEALEDLAAEHAARGRVVAFGPHNARNAKLSHASRVAAVWLQRLTAALKVALK